MLLWITQKRALKASDAILKILSTRHSLGTSSRGTNNIRPDNFTLLPFCYYQS